MKKIRAIKRRQIKVDGLLFPKYMSSLSALGFFIEKDIVGVNVLQNAIFDDILLLDKLTLLYPSYFLRFFTYFMKFYNKFDL